MAQGIQIVGDKALTRDLKRYTRRIEDSRPALKRTALILSRRITMNISNSRGAKGQLAPVEPWTRIVRGANPTSRPLNVTGALKRSFNVLKLSKKVLVFGPRGGRERKKALSMVLGLPGYIRAKESKIQTTDDGSRDYIRIQSSSGQFYTKKVNNGVMTVKPKKRPFIHYTRRDRQKIVQEFEKLVDTRKA